MKKLLKVLGLSVTFLALLMVVFLAYMGVFGSYPVGEEVVGPYKFVYLEHKGPYAESGPVADEVYKALMALGIESKLGFGIYYDDPGVIPAAQLRSEMGCIVPTEDYDKIASLDSRYKVRDLPATNSAVARFPLRNYLSYMLGPMKIYPVLDAYMMAHRYDISSDTGAFEYYDLPAKQIIFALPLSR